MGWNITCIENTVDLDEESARDAAVRIIELCLEKFWDISEDTPPEKCVNAVFGRWWSPSPRTSWKPFFNSDDMEYMDWLTGAPDALQVLADAGAQGRILFGSLQGDNAGSFWGAEFASGQYRRLKGRLVWEPA